MKEFETNNPNAHIFPNIINYSRNKADMNLAFVLGTINNKYDSYITVVRPDKAYDEIQKLLEKINPCLRNHVELRWLNDPDELIQYVQDLKKAQDKNSNISETGKFESITRRNFKAMFHFIIYY